MCARRARRGRFSTRARSVASTNLLEFAFAPACTLIMPTATTPARLALCSPMAETGPEARLLAQHGFALKVVGAGAADITLPRPGGSLAFVLHRGAAAVPRLAERADAASRAARRCTVLLVDAPVSACDAAQALCPAGVGVVRCPSHEGAVEHMLALANRVGAGVDADSTVDKQFEVAKRAAAHLARLWDSDPHEVRSDALQALTSHARSHAIHTRST